jgi:hypothetical protein
MHDCGGSSHKKTKDELDMARSCDLEECLVEAGLESSEIEM